MDERKLIYADDAIRWIKIECNSYGKPTLDFESGKKVIEYLERLPSVQPEHLVKESGNLVKGLVNDCISRQAAIDVLSQYPFEKVVNCISIIEELPSAQPERMRGKWIAYDGNVYMCSCCGKQIITNPDYIKEQKFCFRCGADMRGGQND